MSVYVYCVLTETLSGLPLPAGIQNEKVRLLNADSLYVVVSDFAGLELIPNRENVVSHERVVETVMEKETPLPFRFGIVVSEDKLRDFVQANFKALRAELEKVHGCVEMGLKVMLPPVEQKATTTGTDFLQAKRRLNRLQRDTAGWVDAAVAGLVRQTDVSLMQGTAAAIIRIAHLVLRDHLEEYKSHMECLLKHADYRFLRSGPWPPYSFVSTPRVD
jgi:hypothetical protein